MRELTYALFGNPNTGKTSLFNMLTDSYEYVGNWSGVTVEKKVGSLSNNMGKLIDLPGVYGLNPISEDEEVVSKFLLQNSFDTVINIVDASQLERNLQLTIELLELGKPMIIGLNMVDVAKRKGLRVNIEKLSAALKVPVYELIARNGKGCGYLLENLDNENSNTKVSLQYGEEVEAAIDEIEELIPETFYEEKRWLSIQYLMRNEEVQNFMHQVVPKEQLQKIVDELEEKASDESYKILYNARKHFIMAIINECVTKEKEVFFSGTDIIDNIVTHKFFGLPIFLFLLYIMFQATFTWIGAPLSDLLDSFLNGPVLNTAASLLQQVHASDFITSLITDGIISGVGGVLVFVPQIMVLFFCISLLEDSGYMARIAVVMDRIMEFFGLNGKAFIPMIISFGCNVPGIMAARTIEQKKERLMTILIAPFMSCSARLPVYALFAGAFFAKNQALIVILLYVIGIILALIMTKILSLTLLKNEKSIYFIELPPYRIPQWKTLMRSTWEKGKGFIRKAGTIIFSGSVIIWLLLYIGPTGLNVQMDESYLAIIGGILAPILAPIGIGTWQAASSLITGFLAKEVVVSSMSIIYAINEASLGSRLVTHFTPLTAFVFMVFILLYIPCLATVAIIKRETGSLKWTLFSIVYSLSTAYIVCLLIYQIGKLAGFS